MNKKHKNMQILSFILVFALVFSNFLGFNKVVKAENGYEGPEIIITEICYNQGGKAPFIEIYNTTDKPIKLEDYNIIRSTSKKTTSIGELNGILKSKEASVVAINKELEQFNSFYKTNIDEQNFFKAANSQWGRKGFISIAKSGEKITKNNYKNSSICYAEYSQMDIDKSLNYQYPVTGNAMIEIGEAKPTPGKVDPSQVPETNIAPEDSIEIAKLQIKEIKEIKEIGVRQNHKLEVIYTPENTTQKRVEWSSSDEEIVKVVQDGTITGIAAGNATITAKSVDNDKIYATVDIKVKDMDVNSIEYVRSLKENEPVKVKGIVTGTYKENVFIQDETAGIVIYKQGLNINNLDISVGDKVDVVGTTKDFHGLKEIELKDYSDIKVIEKNVGLPKAKIIKPGENTKEVESQLVTIKNVEVKEKNEYGDYLVEDENSSTLVKGVNIPNLLNQGYYYESITGVAFLEYSNKILVFSKNDVIEDSTVVQAVDATPSWGEIDKGEKVSLFTSTEGADIYYTLDGKEPTNKSIKYEEPIVINEDVTIKAIALKEGLKDSKISIFEYKVVEPQKDIMRISKIQGEGQRSPFEDKNVKNVKGVVTAIQDDGYTKGFYIQDTDKEEENNVRASKGIYINTKNTDVDFVNIGDLVLIDGVVVEEYGDTVVKDSLTITQINPSNIRIKSSGNKLPEPIIIGEGGRKAPKDLIASDGLKEFDPDKYAIDFYETLEGMLVEVKEPLVVGVKESIGEIVVLPDNGKDYKDRLSNNNGVIAQKNQNNPQRIMINDTITPLRNKKSKEFKDPNFKVKVGDIFTESIVGVMSYNFGNYKIFNTEKLPSIKDGGLVRKPTTIEQKEDKLTVVSYNVENFSAKSTNRLDGLTDNIINYLKCPDIIALIEIQDNDGPDATNNSDATETLKVITNDIKKKGGPEYGYVNINPIYNKDGGQPGGNIRPTFIYRKDRVSLVNENPGKPNTAVKVLGTGKDTSLSVNPGRIDPNNSAFERSRKPLIAEFEFKGEKIFAIANHFNSKRGDTPIFGSKQPQELKSEYARKKQSKIVHDFMNEILKANPEANIVCMGDFNDYQYSEPIKVLKGEIMTNMIDKLPMEEQHSYVYQGNSQVLDHILVSNKLSENAKVEIVNINSEFIDSYGRISDHDPVIVQLDLNKDEDKDKGVTIEKPIKPEYFELGKKAEVSIDVTNNEKLNENVTLILAIYDKENNRMITSDVVTKKVSSKREEKLTASIMIPKEGNYKVKYFVWDDLESMKPLTKCETIKVK